MIDRLPSTCTMSEPTHGEDDRPSGVRCADILSRHAVRMQENDRYRLAGGGGIPIWKSSLLRQPVVARHSCRHMACQEFHPNGVEDFLAPDDTGANRGVPPRYYARRKFSKSNSFKILHPAIGNLTKQSFDWHPSVGKFKMGRRE